MDNPYSEEEEINQKEDTEYIKWEFPDLIGKIPEYENGVLELVKVIITIEIPY